MQIRSLRGNSSRSVRVNDTSDAAAAGWSRAPGFRGRTRSRPEGLAGLRAKSRRPRRVRAARPREKCYDIRDDIIPGLFLRAFPSGERSFALDRMTRGRRHFATLGSADTVTVPEARREARRLIASFADTATGDGRPGTPAVVNRAMPVLSRMMRMAELWGYRARNANPCKNTKRYRMQAKERFLAADELARLNAVLTRDES